MSNKLLLGLFIAIAVPALLIAYAYGSHFFFVAVMCHHILAASIGVLLFFFHHPNHPTVVPTDPPRGYSSHDQIHRRRLHSVPEREDDTHEHRNAA
jgi:hypothetical protein